MLLTLHTHMHTQAHTDRLPDRIICKSKTIFRNNNPAAEGFSTRLRLLV